MSLNKHSMLNHLSLSSSHLRLVSSFLAVQDAVIDFNLCLQPLLVAQKSLTVVLLLLDVSTHFVQLGLQPPDDGAQVLKLNVMPAL